MEKELSDDDESAKNKVTHKYSYFSFFSLIEAENLSSVLKVGRLKKSPRIRNKRKVHNSIKRY